MPLLHWLTRDADIHTGNRVPYRLLEEAPDVSHGDRDTGNMLIQGDNLDALKALLPYYAGKVKCIYIDPPYNTKSAFEHYDDNLEHAQWLAMMYPRLEMLRELLAEEGSIWVSIDDNEGHYLKVIMDEVFGRKNFINSVVWQKRISPDNDAKFLSATHDFILAFAKNIEYCVVHRLPRTEQQDARYSNPDNDLRGPWTSSDLTRREYRPHDFYAIKLPSGREVFPAQGRSWSVPQNTFAEMKVDNRIWFGPDGNAMPRRKRFLSEVNTGIVPTKWWDGAEAGKNEDAKREVNRMQPDNPNVFSTPKPEKLILTLFSY